MREYIVVERVAFSKQVDIYLHDSRLTFAAMGIADRSINNIGTILTTLGKQGFRVIAMAHSADHSIAWTLERGIPEPSTNQD